VRKAEGVKGGEGTPNPLLIILIAIFVHKIYNILYIKGDKGYEMS
jgi:hypothetical protein